MNVHNESVLNASSTEGYRFTAIDFLASDTGGELTEKLMDTIKQLKVSDTQGLPYNHIERSMPRNALYTTLSRAKFAFWSIHCWKFKIV